MAASNFYDDMLKGFSKFVDNVKYGDKPILHSNRAIAEVGKFFTGETNTGIRGTLANLADNQSLGKAVKNAYSDGAGKLNYKAIAGTYVGGAIAGRALSGGGAYRDSYGTPNLPGVPFL